MLYKYFPPTRRDFLETLQVRFSPTYALNDPFEYGKSFDAADFFDSLPSLEDFEVWNQNYPRGLPYIDQSMIRKKAAGLLKPEHIEARARVALDSNVGVLSMSRTKSNLLMWAHYTNNFSGFIVGFDDKHPFFATEDPQDRPRAVRYSSTRRSYPIHRDHDPRECLFEKPIEWAYEEEMRVARFLPAQPTKFHENGQPLHLVEIPKEAICEIVVGHEADVEIRNKIANAEKIDCELFTTIPSEERYTVEFIPF